MLSSPRAAMMVEAHFVLQEYIMTAETWYASDAAGSCYSCERIFLPIVI